MKRLPALTQRMRAYLMGRPVILGTADTRMVLAGGRATVAVALRGWGWIAARTAHTRPGWRDWHFFARSRAHVVVPAGPQAQIVTVNLFGRCVTSWHRPSNENRVSTVILAPTARPSLGGYWLPQLRQIPTGTASRALGSRVDVRRFADVVPPVVPLAHMRPPRAPCSAPTLSTAIRHRMTLCGQLVRDAAAVAAAVAHTNDATPCNDDTHDNTNDRANKWDRTK
jgi:hypothetical protein